MEPKVSAMMLTHNRKNWLREAIKGVLNQTYKNFELIIIDNASTDGTEEAVKYFDDERIIYVRNEENVYPGALNQMVDLAKGEYIAICDDDDISLPERFEKSVEFLDANPDVAMVYGDIKRIKQVLDNEIEQDIKYSIDPTFKNIYESDGVVNNPTAMIRKKVIKEVGGYDNNFLIANDYDLSLRMAYKYKIAHLDYFLINYRVHDDNLSLKNRGLTVKYRWRALLKWAKVSCLCFSCNRVFQLENYIRSFFKFINSMKINEKGLLAFSNGGVQLNVLYKDKYKKGYEELIKKYPEVNFIKEYDFKEQVLNWLKNAPNFVMFGCDDVIFKDYVDIEKVMEKLKLKDTIGFSLRLGKGITYCFPIDKFIKEPEYEESDGILKWRWANAEGDYGYPFELAASVYRKEFVISVINSFKQEWGHPNLLEGLGANLIGTDIGTYVSTYPYLYTFLKPKSLVIQINRVQDVSLNRFFDIGYDIETLFQLWEKEKKLDLDYYKKEFNSIYVKDFILEEEKKVSVIIPVYNQKPEYFEECIQSVVNQTRKPYEIIVIDDGSEPSQSIILPDAKGIEIKLVRNKKNMGIGFSRQKGVDEATGDYIAFLSSDDVWDKDFLKIMFETAKQHPGKILYSGSFGINKESNKVKETSPPYHEYEDFCIACWNFAYRNQMFVNFSTLFIPKEVFEKVQFDKSLRFCEDLDFLLRSLKHFQYYLVNQKIVYYRIEDNLTSRIWDKIPEQNEKIRKKCLKYWREDFK